LFHVAQLVGIFQPFRDATKLFSREECVLLVCNYLIYYFSPVLGFLLSLLVWMLVHYLSGFISFEFGLLFFLACTRLCLYTVMIAGWSSNSGYSLLGGLRALAQTISYEVRLAFILLYFVVLVCRYDLTYFYFVQKKWQYVEHNVVPHISRNTSIGTELKCEKRLLDVF
jgi:NADH-ubiquinone oxidoreductase chain 1